MLNYLLIFIFVLCEFCVIFFFYFKYGVNVIWFSRRILLYYKCNNINIFNIVYLGCFDVCIMYWKILVYCMLMYVCMYCLFYKLY